VHYWQHLIEASHALDLCLNKDLASPNGGLAQGTRLDGQSIVQLATVVEPEWVERYVDASPSYSGTLFKVDFLQFINSISDLDTLFNPSEHNHYLNIAEAIISSRKHLAFRLNILKHSLPHEFRRTLFCVAWAIFDSAELNRTDDQLRSLFLVCFYHDIGLVDINRNAAISEHDHRSEKGEDDYYHHAELSVKFLKRYEDSIADEVSHGIQQHHERMDGTGYPKGLAGVHLNEYGQLVHLFDSLYSVFFQFLKPLDKSIVDLKTIIKINAVTHYGAAANRVLSILETLPSNDAVFFLPSEYDKVAADVNVMSSYLDKSIEIIQRFTSKVGFRHDNRQLFVLQNSFIHIALSHFKMQDQLQSAIKREKSNSDAEHRESTKLLEESYIVLREMVFHVKEFGGRLSTYLSLLEKHESELKSATIEADRALSELNTQQRHIATE